MSWVGVIWKSACEAKICPTSLGGYFTVFGSGMTKFVLVVLAAVWQICQGGRGCGLRVEVQDQWYVAAPPVGCTQETVVTCRSQEPSVKQLTSRTAPVWCFLQTNQLNTDLSGYVAIHHKVIQKHALGTQTIILMTCLPCKTVAPLSTVEQISVCLPSRIRMSRIVSISSTAKKAATQCSVTRKLESSSLGANANFSCRTFTCTIWGCNLMNHRSKQDVQLFLLSWDNQHAHDRKRGSMTKTTRKNVLLLQDSYLPKPTCDIDFERLQYLLMMMSWRASISPSLLTLTWVVLLLLRSFAPCPLIGQLATCGNHWPMTGIALTIRLFCLCVLWSGYSTKNPDDDARQSKMEHHHWKPISLITISIIEKYNSNKRLRYAALWYDACV